MKKFVEFSLHEYMDEHPAQQVRIWEGKTIKAIEAEAIAWAKQMTKLYSGGPTSFIKVWTKEEAREWIDKNKAQINENPSSEDKEWINSIEDAFYTCYISTLN